MVKCFECGGYIQGQVYVLCKSHTDNISNDHTIPLYEVDVKYFHPACLCCVAGKNFLTSKDQKDIEIL